jgi:hypothetical protein
MGARYRKQEAIRLELEGGDWLLVKKHLTAGEQRDANANILSGPGGTFKAGERPDIDPRKIGIAQAVAYLIDWSLTDNDDRPLVIRDQPSSVVIAMLENQTPESLVEVLAAIDRHDDAMIAERDQEKKDRTGGVSPALIFTSAE